MSEIRTNIVNSEDGTAAVHFPKGQVVTGIVTSTSFAGSLTGNVTGNVTGNASGTAGGLTGTPNITVGRITLSGSTETNIQTQAATAGGTTTLNMDTADNWIITMGGNTTMGDPTNEKLGQTGSLWMVQDGTGSRTAAWHSSFKWAGGTAPTLSTAANSIDRIDYIVTVSYTHLTLPTILLV